MSKNEKGFSAVEDILVLVVVALVGLAGWLAYNDHHKSSTNSGSNNISQTIPNCNSVKNDNVITTDWTPCRSLSGNFIASFPTPAIPVPQTTTHYSGITYTGNGIQSTSLNGPTALVYNVTYLTFPSGSILPSLSTLLSNHLVAFQDLMTVSTKDTIVNGNKTETYELTATQNNIKYDITGKMVQVGRVVYRIETTSGNAQQAPGTQRFIASFRLTS